MHDNDWTVGMGDAMLTHRSEKHPGELPVSSTPDDKQTRLAGHLYQHRSRVALGDDRPDLNTRVGVSYCPQGIVQHGSGVRCRMVALREREQHSEAGPFPGRDRDKGGPGELRLSGRPVQGGHRRGRAVDPHHDLGNGL